MLDKEIEKMDTPTLKRFLVQFGNDPSRREDVAKIAKELEKRRAR